MSVLEQKRALGNNGGGSQDERTGSGRPGSLPGVIITDPQADMLGIPATPELGADEVVPPAYSEVHDRFSLQQPGFEAGADITDDGRINININQTSSRLADIIAPTLSYQLRQDALTAATAPLPPAYIPPSLGGHPGQTPPPRLNVVIQIVGSRGDVQPFVALGQVLKDTYGHRVRIATHPTFKGFVEENGLEFFSIGGDPAELMAFMVKHPGLMPGFDAVTSGEVTKRRKGIEQIIYGCWRSCIEAGDGLGPAPRLERRRNVSNDGSTSIILDPSNKPFVADAIIANPPSFAHIHVAEKLGVPLHLMFTMPWSPTRAFPQPLANIQSTNTDPVTTNYISYTLVEMMTWQGLGDVINRFRTKVLDLDPLSLIWAPGVLTRLRIPYTYCWSPALIPKPADWGNHIDIAGFYFLNLASNFTPDPELAAFLEAGPPPVYIGFGSIVVDDPNGLTKTIFDAVAASGVRALVSKGWGGIGADSVGIPDGVYMLGNVPHDWLFKHVSAVCHHGGAGTTAAGINAGKPTIVVPFFGDQPFWGAMVARAGAGPDPIPYKKLTAEALAEALEFVSRPETQDRAKELGAKIREEKGADIGGQSFHSHLDLKNIRCSLAPSRVAVWRLPRTNMRLSALAASTLVSSGYIQWSDLKLFRSREYNTEDEPWDPITACSSALLGDIGNISMAVADFPRDVFKAAKSTAQKKPKDSPAGASGEGTVGSPSTTDAASVATGDQPGLNDSKTDPANLVQSPGLNASATSLAPSTSTASVGSSQPAGASAAGQTQPTPSTQKPASGAPSGSNPLEQAVGAGKSIETIVTTGFKSPMNFCMGLARGFRNAPKLYNDETIRPPEKVTGFASGVKVAGKEFGLGMFDGISGLVTQPMKGAEKEGTAGLIKGFGKGIGGLVFKPAAAVWSIPAYTMAGLHAEIRSKFAQSAHNYIVASRISQGNLDFTNSTSEERDDIEVRWLSMKHETSAFSIWKQKGKGRPRDLSPAGASPAPELGSPSAEASSPGEPPQTGWRLTRNMSFESRKRLQEQKQAWKQRQAAIASGLAAASSRPADSNGPASIAPQSRADQDAEFERAIQAAVRETSRGNAAEDIRIEQAIRHSVTALRRDTTPGSIGAPPAPPHRSNYAPSATASSSTAASTAGASTAGASTAGASTAATSTAPPAYSTDFKGGMPLSPNDFDEVTDEEYQAYIEQAVRASIAEEQSGPIRMHSYDDDDENDEEYLQAIQRSQSDQQVRSQPGQTNEGEDEELRKAIEASRAEPQRPSTDGVDDDAELQRAIEESERAHKESLAEAEDRKKEEDIVMAYIKKQSLAEEELRKKGKGKARTADDDDDGELQRAMAESMRIDGKAGEGSGTGGGTS